MKSMANIELISKSIIIERLFWLFIGVFMFLALITSIRRTIKQKQKDDRVTPIELKSLAELAADKEKKI